MGVIIFLPLVFIYLFHAWIMARYLHDPFLYGYLLFLNILMLVIMVRILGSLVGTSLPFFGTSLGEMVFVVLMGLSGALLSKTYLYRPFTSQ